MLEGFIIKIEGRIHDFEESKLGSNFINQDKVLVEFL